MELCGAKAAMLQVVQGLWDPNKHRGAIQPFHWGWTLSPWLPKVCPFFLSKAGATGQPQSPGPGRVIWESRRGGLVTSVTPSPLGS